MLLLAELQVRTVVLDAGATRAAIQGSEENGQSWAVC